MTLRQAANPTEDQIEKLDAIGLMDLAYIAGLFDAGGYITITEGKRDIPRLSIGVTHSKESVIAWLGGLMGGNIGWISGEIQKKRKDGSNRLDIHAWNANGWLANEILIRLFPYLRIKDFQAGIAKQFWMFFKNYKKLNDSNSLKMMMQYSQDLRKAKKPCPKI